ncbi:hypothetical protein ABT299_02420 [Spirillospora sp. NPDC000708]|uniref:hypothetical protein n=1 Tax=Actinomadura nitritigenes TaxID=134602 RepID=UPI0033608B2A
MRLYPADYRREYAPLIAQLVHDLAREAQARGPLGRAALSATALADLAVTALQERLSRSRPLSRSALVRWSGLASAAGGAAFMAGMLTPLHGPLRIAVPAGVLGMAAGAAGLFAVLHGRRPGLERLGLLLAGSGLALGLLGMTAGDALGPFNRWGRLLNDGEHLGLAFIGAGMVTWGFVAVRTGALGRWSFTPIPIGLCGLAGLTFIAPDTFRALENGPLPLVFSGAWILLGLALLLRGDTEVRAPVTSF